MPNKYLNSTQKKQLNIQVEEQLQNSQYENSFLNQSMISNNMTASVKSVNWKDQETEEIRRNSKMEKWENLLAQDELMKQNEKEAAMTLLADRYDGILQDASLSEKVQKGLQQIDRWIVSNMNLGSKQLGKQEFFLNLFRLSDRERLYIYYLVESGKRKSPNEVDMMISQTTYEPNLTQFESIMKASSFKVWKKIGGSNLYWNKLVDAYALKTM